MNKIIIRIVLIISITLQLFITLFNIKCAFLQGKFRANEKPVCIKVLKGLENKYLSNVILKLLALIYRLKNVAITF